MAQSKTATKDRRQTKDDLAIDEEGRRRLQPKRATKTVTIDRRRSDERRDGEQAAAESDRRPRRSWNGARR